MLLAGDHVVHPMYVRDAKNREEVWLLDRIEEMGLDETAFRSRDYVVAIDEITGEKAGFGRIRVHATEEEEKVCELTSIGVLEEWRDQGVGAHVIERLLEYAGDQGFSNVYALTDSIEYFLQFGFEPIDTVELPGPIATRLSEKQKEIDGDVIPLRIDPDDFEMPDALREAFKRANESNDTEESYDESPEDFGIDPDSATYKYDTGR